MHKGFSILMGELTLGAAKTKVLRHQILVQAVCLILFASCSSHNREIPVVPITMPLNWWAFSIPEEVTVAAFESPKKLVRYACVAAFLTKAQSDQFLGDNQLVEGSN
jgi:hypothetical protein